MVSTRNILAAVAVSLPACFAQTSTTCNPLDSSCSPDTALSSSSFSSSWTSSSSLDGWSTTAGKVNFGNDGAEFTINGAGDAPTIQTDFYIFFGSVEVTMRAAPGTGIVSSIVLLSDVLDEVDWEFTGSNTAQTQTNYFGKGNTTTYDRAIWYGVASPQTTSHTYTINWTSETITWAIDGTVVRTLAYADANGGENYPQTPMRVRIGNWAGGAPGNPEGTIEWAGGETDFSQAPFTMAVSSVKITNYSPGSEYIYKDNTGSYNSIQVQDGSTGTGSSDSSSSSSISSSSSSSKSAVVFAPSPSSSIASTSSSASETKTTAAAGITVKASSTAVASSVRASTAKSDAQLTTIPLQASSTTSGHSSRSSSSTTAGGTSSSNGTTTSASTPASPSSTSGSSALSKCGNAAFALVLLFATALVVA